MSAGNEQMFAGVGAADDACDIRAHAGLRPPMPSLAAEAGELPS